MAFLEDGEDLGFDLTATHSTCLSLIINENSNHLDLFLEEYFAWKPFWICLCHVPFLQAAFFFKPLDIPVFTHRKWHSHLQDGRFLLILPSMCSLGSTAQFTVSAWTLNSSWMFQMSSHGIPSNLPHKRFSSEESNLSYRGRTFSKLRIQQTKLSDLPSRLSLNFSA